MPVCRNCGGRSHRVHRTFLERFRFAAAYRCPDCGKTSFDDQWYLFLIGRVSRCPNCGNYRVRKLRRVDKIDPMYKNPLSYLQRFFGANLHWCPACRLQFYDLRPKLPANRNEAGSVGPVGLGEQGAVHPDGLAGHEGAVAAGEESDHPPHVGRLPDPPQGG